MKILITGATGYIGSHLVKQLRNENHRLFCTLLKDETNPFGEESVKSTIFSDHNIDENVDFFINNNIEGIIHLASLVQSGEHKSSDVEALIDTNVKFSATLLETAAQAKVKWFINTGTYWQNYNNQDYSPVNLYAATKEAFMDIARYYFETDAIKFATIKLFETYGPNDTRPKIFNLWERIAKTGEALDMSPGEQLIDISYIDDIVNAFTLLATHLHNNNPEVANGVTYAVKAEKRYLLKELSSIFEEVTRHKLNINWGVRKYKGREIMNPWTEAKVVPDWKPKISIIDGINLLFNQKNL
jgi:nucleoside-diphosphate-sugar epimerase